MAVVTDFKANSARLRSQLHASVMVLFMITRNLKKMELGIRC